MQNMCVVDNMQEVERKLNALQGLMDMVSGFAEHDGEQDPRSNYMEHISQLVSCVINDIRAHIDEAMSEYMVTAGARQ